MTDNPAADKKAIRRQALARRDALDRDWRIAASLRMAGTARGAISVAASDVVSGFWPMRSEVDVRTMLADFQERGARICLPAILDRETIVFREWLREAPLVEMGFGTSGPGPDAVLLRPTIMLAPLAAFDARGHRIGYGGGYYDRAIARLTAEGHAPRLIGVAFDCQEVPRVPDEPHDIAVSEILTESGLRRSKPSDS